VCLGGQQVCLFVTKSSPRHPKKPTKPLATHCSRGRSLSGFSEPQLAKERLRRWSKPACVCGITFIGAKLGRSRSRRALTIVELLVVVAILSILLALLLPSIAQVRVRSRQTACAAALHNISHAFNAYSADNGGWWPMARHDYAPPGVEDRPPFRTRTKRWHDFLSQYLGSSVNADGTNPTEILLEKYATSPLRGCTAWSGKDCSGYAMNVFPMASATRPVGQSVLGVEDWACRFNVFGLDGWYFRASQWTNGSQRCLIFDSITADASFAGWPWWSGNGPMPDVPHIVNFSADFNRHSGRTRGTRESTPSVNILYCDGHVELTSARAANYSVLFSGPR